MITTYTIAPLKWEHSVFADYPDWKQEHWKAAVPFGSYTVVCVQDKDGEIRFRLNYCFTEYNDEGEIPCDSVEHGQCKAFADWKRRLLPALTETEATNANQ